MLRSRILAASYAVLLALLCPLGAHADEPTWWRPGTEQRLALHVMLAGPLNVNDPVQMGLRDFNGNVLPEPDIYDIDGEMNSAATVQFLHDRGKRVICYIDAGVYEDYRSDAPAFQAITPQIWGNQDVGWPGSYWLDVRRVSELEPIMKARMQMCRDKGFDAVRTDEVEGWSNDTGFPITYHDQIVYNLSLAQWAHELGLSVGLEGDIAQVRDLVNAFDWTLNEECFQYKECTSPWDASIGMVVPGLQLFVQQNKAVFVAEYKAYTDARWTDICNQSMNYRFNTSRYRLGLPRKGGRMPCSTAIGW